MSEEIIRSTDDGTEPTEPSTPQGGTGGSSSLGKEKILPEHHSHVDEALSNETNTETKIQEMEVHKHPHHVTHKKKWGEYFLEFLMIFLAVTLGFFAESFREHLVERKKEKEYMKEIVVNLKYDTLRCKVNAISNDEAARGLDSLRAEIKNAVSGRIDGNALYYYSLKYIGEFGQVAFNTSAIDELRNSGSLRLIENIKIVSEILDYYERKIYAAKYYMPSTVHIDELQKTQSEIFSLINFDDYVQSFKNIDEKTYVPGYDYQKIREHVPALALLKYGSADLEKFYTQVSQFEIEIRKYNFWILYCKKAAEKLISDIQKEYHLENE